MAESTGNGNSGNGNSGNGQGQGQSASTSNGPGAGNGNGQGAGQSVGAEGNGNGNGPGSGNGNGNGPGSGNGQVAGTEQGAEGNEGQANAAPSYNKQGVDANGKTKNGKNGDRNGDGKISAGESFVNNLSNWAYDFGQRADSFLGGADENGNTKAGRAADRNGDGKISFGERIGNMFNNAAVNINQTFGGVNYQGKNKSGEQVVAPGEHVTLAQRAKNIGHNLASRNGATWNDSNNNGIMDGSEVGRAAAINAATFGFNLVPGFGKALGDFAAGAATGKSNNVAGQLGANFGEGGNTNANPSANISYSGGSTLTPLKEKEELKPNTNFIKRAKKIDISKIPSVTSTYIKRGEEKAPAITVSDEELKSFALRFYHKDY